MLNTRKLRTITPVCYYDSSVAECFLLKLLFVLSPPLTVIPCFIGESKNPKTIPQENANADNIKISLFFIFIPLKYLNIFKNSCTGYIACFKVLSIKPFTFGNNTNLTFYFAELKLFIKLF